MEFSLAEPRWYVVQALTGQEYKALRGLQAIIQSNAANEKDCFIYEVAVPEETIEERKNNKKTIKKRKLYPGYVLVKTTLYNEDETLKSDTYRLITETKGVIDFIGNKRNDEREARPMPLTEEDVAAMLQQRAEEEIEKPKVVYQVGETVIIREGAFEGYEGMIEDVDTIRQRVKVAVSIFGRSTPVEVEIWQVERPS